MLPFGHYVSKWKDHLQPTPSRIVRQVHSWIVGNGDLHALVRCPPIASRWNRVANKVCDIGCGSGDFHLDTLMRINFKGIVIGVDKDYEALRQAKIIARRAGLESGIHYVCASADQLPFRDHTFNQVFLVDVIEHVANDGHVFEEAHRVLKKDALLEISAPTPLYPAVFGRRIHSAVGHVRDGYPLADLIQKIRRYHFDVVRTEQNTGYLLWPWMALWFRIAWKGLWNPGPKNRVIRFLYHIILALLSLIVRLLNPLDRFGGYCTNAIEATKKSNLEPATHE